MTERRKPVARIKADQGAGRRTASRKAADAGRRQGAAEARALLALAADWSFRTDADDRFVSVDEGFAQLTGLAARTVIGRSLRDLAGLMPPDHPGRAAMQAALSARMPFRDCVIELASARPDCRIVAVSAAPLRDPDGAFAGYRGIARNVTGLLSGARREAVEADPGTDRDWLMTALDRIGDAVVRYDAYGRIVTYNQALLRIYRGLEDVFRPGLALGELLDAGLARGIWDIGDETPEAWRTAFLAMRRRRRDAEVILRFADGRWVLHREIVEPDGSSIGVCTDITAIKEGEARALLAHGEAERAERRLQAAIDALSDGFVLWDAEDRLIVCNDAFRKQFAFLPNLQSGRTFEEMFLEFAKSGLVKDAVGREEEWVRMHMASRGRELGMEIVFQTHDGRWMQRRDEMTAFGDRVGIRTDITEVKRREGETAAANVKAEELLYDLRRTLDTMAMGVVLLDADLNVETINKAFYEIWKVDPTELAPGCPFRALIDVNRGRNVYRVSDEDWEAYVATRVAEIAEGDVAPREFRRADGITVMYAVTALSGGKRLVTYYDITDLKERETVLEQALERSSLADAVLNGVGDPIFVKDQELRYVFVNEAFARQHGRTPDELIGLTSNDVLPAETAARMRKADDRVLETGEPFEMEEVYAQDGVTGARMVRKSRIRTASGKDYLSGFLYDITEMKKNEAEARQAHRQLVNVLESLPAGVVIYDSDDRFVMSNRLIHETLPAVAPMMQPGRPLRDVVEAAHDAGYFRVSGDAALDALYDSDREAWIEGYLKRYQVAHAVSERQNGDGRWYQVYDTRTEDGVFIGVRVDITTLKERERALEESMRENEVFQSLIDNVPVAIYAKRPDLKLAYVNKGWCDLTGFAKSEAIGRTDVEIFGPEGEPFMQADLKVLEERHTLEVEETATQPDGTLRHQIARKSAMIANDGSLYLIGSTTDVSELKRREEELRVAEQKAIVADRAKSEFLANMSHEIRTPMNGVLGMAELLTKTELDPKQKTFTDIIVKSSNALLTIINDILDFSKIDAGQMVLDPAPFNLAEAVEDVATLVTTRAKEKDLELIVRIDPRLPRLFVGDAGRIRQVITNLMGNAVKFTDEGHVLVDVSGQVEADRATLHVKVVDTGIGIPEEMLARVFEKFSQVDGTSTRRYEGTGLGLAISSSLIDLMDGRMGVASKPGQGSTFWFEIELPVAEASAPRKVAPLDVTGARILVVDDNAVNRSILMEQMNSWAFDACAAGSAKEGLAVLRAAADMGIAVDCVVLDYQMPLMSGADMARIVRDDPLIADTPIVMLTSVDQTLSGAQYRDLGVGAQLIKPARSSVLLETLVSEIQKQRSRTGRGALPLTLDDDHVGANADEQAFREALHEPEAPASDTVADPSPAARPALRPAGASGQQGPDILVAEDNEVNQLVFTQILGETPFRFEIVSNGRLALEAFKRMAPRMILMDVSMPEMNGTDATKAIREHEATHGGHVPIVGVTAHALRGDRERCLDAGMDDYLPKPISPNALLKKVYRWLEDPANFARDAI